MTKSVFGQQWQLASRRPRPKPRQARRALPRVEALEAREVPTSSVTSQVIGFDPATGTQTILPADPLLHGAIQQLRAEGFAGLFGDETTRPDGTPRNNVGPRELLDGVRTIFGTDDRTQVTATTTYPWRTVGRLTFSAGGCSGAMVSPYHLLTAGHCVHAGSGGAWYSNFQVALGQENSTDRPYGLANWTYARTYTGWTTSSDWNWDFALITLDRRVGNTTGWLGREWYADDGVYDGLNLNSAGYPGDKPPGTMWSIYGPVDFATTNRLFFNGVMDVWNGQSGSSMWRYDGTDRYVNGVVTHHACCGYPNHNSGTRMTQGKFNDVGSWITTDNTDRPPNDRADLVDYDDWFSTSSAGFSPATVRPGQSFAKTAYVQNNGTATAASYRVSFYASTDTTITTGDYFLGEDTLTSHSPYSWQTASNTSAFPNVPAGQYYLGWIIDRLGQVTEFDEANNVGEITTTRINVLPAAPASLNATAISTSQINLSWPDVNGETGYRVERSPNGSTGWVQIAQVGANVVTYSNTALAAGTQYFYRVRAYHSVTGNGDYSPVDNATTFVIAPASLTATAASSSRINLSWTNVFGEQGYRVERSPNGSSGWVQIATTGVDVTTYADTSGLAIGTTYFYRVRGYNVSGNGAYSPTDSAQTLALGGFTFSAAPSSVTAGQTFSFTVTARDTGGNVAVNYLGTVTFSTSDPSGGTLPPNFTFTAVNAGSRTFSGVSLYVAGPQSITVRDTLNPGANGTVNITVNPGRVTYYWIYPGSELATSVTQNVPTAIYIFPFDVYFNWITNYAGTIAFYTPDPLGVVPANYTFTGLEGGIGVPGSVTFGTLGLQELFVWDHPGVTVFGYAQYDVLAPSGPAPGGPPSGGDMVELLAAAARPAIQAVGARLDNQGLPALDAASMELLFARPSPAAPQEAVQQLVAQQRPAPVVERWSTLVTDEIFQAV